MIKKWQTQQGKQLEKEVAQSLNYLKEKWSDFWSHRLMDHKQFYVLNKKLRGIRQPADYIACHCGKTYLLECKSSRAKRYNFSYVKDHQIQSLLDIEKAGGEGWILLGWRRWTEKPRRENRLFGFRIARWLCVVLEMERKGFKSVDWDTVIKRATCEFDRNPPYWKLEKVFQ